MLLWIIVTYLAIGVLITALVSKGTFWFNEHKEVGWAGYILGLIILIVIAPCSIVHGIILWCVMSIRQKKGVEP